MEKNEEVVEVQIFSSTNEYEVNKVCAILTENNIPFIRKNDGSGSYMNLYMGQSIQEKRILVSKENYEKSLELISLFISDDIDKKEEVLKEEQIKTDNSSKYMIIRRSLGFLILVMSILAIISIIGLFIYIKTVEEKNIISSENNIINNENIYNNNILKKEDAEKIAKEILDKYIKLSNYENNNIGPMPYILIELGLETEENINLLISKTDDTTVYIKSNTRYEDFKEKLSQYVSEKYFLEKFSQYKNIDGYVGVCNCTGSKTPIEVNSIKLSSVDGNQYTFNVVFKDLEVYEHYLNPEEGKNITDNDYLYNKYISFEYINNKLVISQWQ